METSKLKKRFLELLKTDEEFRYTVAGYIGLGEILETLKELREKAEEHDRKFNEILERLDRHTAILEEHTKLLEEHGRRLEEHDRKFNEILAELKAHRQMLEEHSRRLEEHSKKLEEHDRRLAQISYELGALSESFYSKAFWDDFKEALKADGEKVKQKRRNAKIGGREVDLLIVTDKHVYIVEVKVKPKQKDVKRLHSLVKVAAKEYPELEAKGILAGTHIGSEVEKYAQNKGIQVYRV